MNARSSICSITKSRAPLLRFVTHCPINDYQGLRAVGVTVGFVQKLLGIIVAAPDELTRLRVNADSDS